MMWQGGIEGLDIREPDEAELEAPTIDHTWTIKVSAGLAEGFRRISACAGMSLVMRQQQAYPEL